MLLLLCVICLTWLLAKGIWLLIAPPTAPNLQPMALQPQMVNQVNDHYVDFFMKANQNTNTQPPPDIRVLGVTLAEPERYSFAILSANNQIKNYKIGDVIEGSPYQLLTVTQTYVEIADKNGQSSQIPFGQPFSLDQSAMNRAKSATQLQGHALTNVQQATSESWYAEEMFAQQAEIAVPPTGNTVSQALEQAVTELQNDPEGYFNQMGVVISGQGYEVTNDMPNGLRNRLGLQAGDRVISVNGQNVGQNVALDVQVLQQIRQSGQAQIQVQRGEQTITLRQSF